MKSFFSILLMTVFVSCQNSNQKPVLQNPATVHATEDDAIKKAVARTGKVLILHEDCLIGGIGGEISAWIAEHCYTLLDAPIMRCASLDTPIPFSIELEKNFMAYSRLGETIERLISY